MVVPAYNERDRLPTMIEEAVDYFEKQQEEGDRYKDGVEVLIVDDGSTDDTSEVALDLSKRWFKARNVEIRVIKLERNRGKGGAVRHVSPAAESLESAPWLIGPLRASSSHEADGYSSSTRMVRHDSATWRYWSVR